MTADAITNPQLDSYLLSLRAHLAPITPAEREDILREITAHIQDSIAESGEPAAAVIARLGPPEELAAQYSEGLFVRRASRSLSPLLLLRATLRLASKGLVGTLVFVCGLFGYAAGAGLILTALLKPIFPAHTGLWLANGHFADLGMMLHPPPSPAHEVLDWWYVFAALVVGVVLCALTTYAIRMFLRLSRRWQKTLALHSSTAVAQTI
jgi:uncharacterized membrane protein